MPLQTNRNDLSPGDKDHLDLMPLSLVIFEIIFDKGNVPLNCRFVYVNKEFESMTGIVGGDITGKTILEVFPATEKIWIERFGNVALSGKVETFESFSCELNKFFRIKACKYHDNNVIVMYDDISYQKEVQIRLEENKQVLGRLVSNLPGIAYRCKYDPAWTMEFISKGCLMITGYTDEEFYQNKISWGSLIDDTDRLYVWSRISKQLKKKLPFQFEYRIRTKNGRLKWVWEKGTGIYDLNGEVIGIEGFINDITERRLTEDALAESMRSYRDLIDGMNETIWIIDLQGNIIDINKRAIDTLGYTKEELISIGLTGIDSTLEPEKIEELAKNMPVDKFQIFETTHKSKSGKIIPVEIYSSLVNYHGKKSVLSIARDISRRKREEKIRQILFEIAKTSTNAGAIEDLMESFYDRLLEIFNASDLVVALYNPDSPVFRVVGHGILTTQQWSVNHSLPGIVFKSGQTLILPREEGIKLLKIHGIIDESEFPLLWAGVPLRENDSIIGVLVVTSTIEKMYDANTVQLLETIAHELTVVIQRQRMIQDLIIAKNKAEESDRLKTAFLANISHEIRTPMNGILGFLDLLRLPDLDEQRKEKFIELVNVSGQRLLETINKIIESAKLEAGQVELDLSRVDLDEIMMFHYDFFQQQALTKSLSFNMNIGVRGIRDKIKADKFKLNAVLTNLLNNAFKFTNRGGVEFGNYSDGDNIVFYVRDTGIGIPAEKVSCIFDRFVQADNNVTRPYEGSGLGLSIVRAYVEIMNGRIWVESEVDKGSTFYFSIPLIRVENEKSTVYDSKIDLNKPTQGLKILIAEDDQISLEYLSTILTDSGFNLIHTTNGHDTVKAVMDNPDLSIILLDIKMPGMSGLEAAGRIREFNKRIPIIAQSAHAFGDIRKKAIEAGFTDYISKPVNRLDLLSLIEKYSGTNG